MSEQPVEQSSSIDQALDLDVVIIACNNERTIAKTLRSVSDLAKRIVVVDSGSKDRTVNICESLGAEVIHHDWDGHIAQKNFALAQAFASWVLSLDSDEWLDEELQAAVHEVVKRNDPSVVGYEMNRRLFVFGRSIRHAYQPEWRLRLVRRNKAKWGGYDPHDQLQIINENAHSTVVRRLTGTIVHESWADVSDLVRSSTAHGLRAAESYYRMGKRGSFLRLLVSPTAAIIKQLIVRGGIFDGWPGWLCAFSAGLSATVKAMHLLELTKGEARAE